MFLQQPHILHLHSSSPLHKYQKKYILTDKRIPKNLSKVGPGLAKERMLLIEPSDDDWIYLPNIVTLENIRLDVSRANQ